MFYQHRKQHTNLVIAQLKKYKQYNKPLKNQWNSNNFVLFVLLIILKHLIQSIKSNFGKYSLISKISIYPIYENAKSTIRINLSTINLFRFLKGVRKGDFVLFYLQS